MRRNLLTSLILTALILSASAVSAEKYRFTFVTHGGPGNPFWNVVIKGMEDAGHRYDVDLQWLSNPTFSIEDMPNFLEDARATIAKRILSGRHTPCPYPNVWNLDHIRRAVSSRYRPCRCPPRRHPTAGSLP